MRKTHNFQDLLSHFYALFVVLVTLWVYVKTLAPTVSFFDSGELIAAAYTLGVAHPPGYPLYVLLGWFFSKLPIGEGAYRINLMSAFFAACAALMVYYITYTILRNPQSAIRNPQSAIRNPQSAIRNPKFDPRPLNPNTVDLRGSVRGELVEPPVKKPFDRLRANGGLLNSTALPSNPDPQIPQIRNPQSAIRNPNAPNPERMLHPVMSMIAALMFAFSLTHWQHAVIAEVYPLNVFLCGLIVLLLIKWHDACVESGETPSPDPSHQGRGINAATPTSHHPRLLYVIALLFGLGFGNHQTISLLFFAAGFLVLMTTLRILFDTKKLFLLLLFLMLGLSIYALIPIRAAQKPPINWGNPVTWRQFKWLVTREGYKNKNVPHGDALQTLWNELLGKEESPSQQGRGTDEEGIVRIYHTIVRSLFLKQLSSFNPVREFGSIGVGLALLGMLYALIFHRVIGFTLLIAVLSMVSIITIITDAPEENIFLVEHFHTPSYLLVAVWIGIGVMAIARLVLWVAGNNKNLQYVVVFMLAVSFLVLPGRQMLKNVGVVDRRRNYVAYDYAMNMLNSLKPNAILFTWGDSGAFPLWYLQIVEGRRPDVTLIHIPHLGTDWYVESLPPDLFFSPDPYHKYNGDVFSILDEIVRKKVGLRPIYFDYSSAHSIALPYPLLPNGITYKVEMPGDKLDEDVWNRYSFRGILDNTRIAKDPDIRRAFLMYGSAHIELGHYYMELDQLKKAAFEFNLAVRFAPELGDGIVRMLRFQDKIIGKRSENMP
jgi:hypothetical protein